MGLGFVTRDIAGRTVLTFDGALDMSTLPQLSDILARHAEGGSTLAIDLDGITVLDDASVGIIIGAGMRQRESGGRLIIVCTNSGIVDRLERMGASGFVSIVGSVLDIA